MAEIWEQFPQLRGFDGIVVNDQMKIEIGRGSRPPHEPDGRPVREHVSFILEVQECL
jgi:hypothetical protein